MFEERIEKMPAGKCCGRKVIPHEHKNKEKIGINHFFTMFFTMLTEKLTNNLKKKKK